MSAPVIAFCSQLHGVGKTSLVYHLAWMYAELGLEAMAVDLDPQAALTSLFLDAYEVRKLWGHGGDLSDPASTIAERLLMFDPHQPRQIRVQRVGERLMLVAGEVSLSRLEAEVFFGMSKSCDAPKRAFEMPDRVSAVIREAARSHGADIVLLDLPSSLGAITRAGAIAADHIVIPLSPDRGSLQAMESLGPALRVWAKDWNDSQASPAPPKSAAEPLGYVLREQSLWLDSSPTTDTWWSQQIPNEYLRIIASGGVPAPDPDPNCLGVVRQYPGLYPMAREARKPVFHLKPADGAIGAHMHAAHRAYKEYRALAGVIAGKIGLPLAAAQ